MNYSNARIWRIPPDTIPTLIHLQHHSTMNRIRNDSFFGFMDLTAFIRTHVMDLIADDADPYEERVRLAIKAMVAEIIDGLPRKPIWEPKYLVD